MSDIKEIFTLNPNLKGVDLRGARFVFSTKCEGCEDCHCDRNGYPCSCGRLAALNAPLPATEVTHE